MVAAALFLIARLVLIQVVEAASLRQYAQSLHDHRIPLPAPRGEILDAGGKVLAMDVPLDQVVAVPREVTHPRREAATLAKLLPFTERQIYGVLDQPKSWYGLLDRGVSPALGQRIAALNLPGIEIVPTTGRSYPGGTLASQVLGMVGANGQGLGGIEYAMNSVLAGKAGYETVVTDAAGNPLPAWEKAYQAPVPGDSVELTIDGAIEADAQKWLKWGVERVHALNGTVIIEDPATGAIVALANWPNFNPNNYVAATPQEEDDFAVQDPVPPGSIFKPVTAAAALTLGLVTPNTLFYTKGYQIVDGVRINDWNPKGWGWITLTQAVEVSSDQVFLDLALKLGVQDFYRFVKAFGFFHPSGVGLPGDSNGVWLPENQVNAVDLATMGFGQGFAATPMQVVAAISAIVNNGTMMQPHIVKAILSPSGQVLRRTPLVVEGRPISTTVAQEIQQMMVDEATYGTGIPAQVPGYIIGGKTGTAQKVVNGRTSNSQFVSSYLGFGPYPHPRFVMLVMINRPVGKLFYGDQVAAPVWQHIAQDLFHYWKIAPYATGDNGSLPGPPPKP
ncbi:MAG: penicillin-binding protein 2 [Firmicutes bacterium]|nr:penicillin-binding protein 2 [Alicyclobacillaceae bacterium]MCL6497789.1 penicillin-binding protein 2 [Bacillota bacterium]